MLGTAPKIVAEVVDVRVDLWMPRLDLLHYRLEHYHAVITLVIDLSDADQLDVDHALLEV